MNENVLIDKISHIENNLSADIKNINLNENPTVVKLNLSKEDILEIRKEQDNAVIVLKNGETITLNGFFKADHSLVLHSDNNELLWVRFTNEQGLLLDNIVYSNLEDVELLLYSEGVANPLLWAFVPLTAAGILAWAGHDHNNNENKNGNDTTAPVVAATQKDLDTIGVDSNEDGKVVIKDKDGNIIGEGNVSKDGSVDIDLKRPLIDGEDVTVEVTDGSGNTGKDTITVGDTTAPVVDAIQKDQDTISVDSNEDGKVVIKDKDGNILGEGNVSKDGSVDIDLKRPLIDGEDVTVEVTDGSGNTGKDTITAGDTTGLLVAADANRSRYDWC